MPFDAFQCDGFVIIPAVLGELQCDVIAASVDSFASDSPGTRGLLAHDWYRALVAALRAHPTVGALIPADHVAVQCTYFEKSVDNNWLVPVHQDLSIPAGARVEHPALRGWSEKEGALFVQAPAQLLETLVAVRVHLDPCLETDGPLQFVPATHARGRIDATEANRLKQAGRSLPAPWSGAARSSCGRSLCTRHRRRPERADVECCISCSGRPCCHMDCSGSMPSTS
jgi:hypothetical protein